MGRLELSHITKVFSEGKTERKVLRDLSFTVDEGEFVSLLGPSGCGKSTLLSMIGGFQTPSEGEIFLDGKRIEGPSMERGYVFQNYMLFPWMSVQKNISYGMKFTGMPEEEKKKRLEELLEMSHLKEHRNKYPIQLSGGMQQRVAVARALAGRPGILLMDEPLGAVDFQLRELMQNELERIIQEARISVVMVTHDVPESVFLSDRVIVMSTEGEILEEVPVLLPRSRNRESAEFEAICHHLSSLLRKAFLAKRKEKEA